MTSLSLLTTLELSELLRISPRTLANWRCQGRIPFTKIGGAVRYRPEDVASWVAASTKAIGG